MMVKIDQLPAAHLDLVRGVSANLVAVGHMTALFGLGLSFLPYGGISVPPFFLMIGFPITLSALARLATGQPMFSDCFSDRIARVCTPFIPALILVALAVAMMLPTSSNAKNFNDGPLVFLGNLPFLNDYPVLQFLSNFVDISQIYIRSYRTAEPLWTVAVEFWIYVFFGSLVFLLFRREKARTWIWIPAAIVIPIVVWNGFAGGGGGLSVVWAIGSLFAVIWIGSQRRGTAFTPQVGVSLSLRVLF